MIRTSLSEPHTLRACFFQKECGRTISIVVLLDVRTHHKFKGTHSEKAPSNKTPALRKITDMGVWAAGTLSP